MATSWELVPCLEQLRIEFNEIAPERDKASDGSIGDIAHQKSVSDHNPDETGNVPIRDADRINEVHAIDVDKDLRLPDGVTMETVVQFLLARCRAGLEKRLRYIIFNRRIWSASTGWDRETYTGANPHDEHAHFSASYDSKLEASEVSWKLEELVMPSADEIADAVIRKLRNTPDNLSDTERTRIARAMLNATEPNPFFQNWDGQGDKPDETIRLGGLLRMSEFRAQGRQDDLTERLTRLEEKLDNLSAGGES